MDLFCTEITLGISHPLAAYGMGLCCCFSDKSTPIYSATFNLFLCYVSCSMALLWVGPMDSFSKQRLETSILNCWKFNLLFPAFLKESKGVRGTIKWCLSIRSGSSSLIGYFHFVIQSHYCRNAHAWSLIIDPLTAGTPKHKVSAMFKAVKPMCWCMADDCSL